MSRQLRIQHKGALYHITARGNARADIYRDDRDRLEFLEILRKARNRYNCIIYAYCLMDNHYHLLIETPDANLSQFMRQLNSVYTQRFNFNYKQTGHIFEGRFKSIMVQKDLYLLELSRYIVLNPVRAGMVRAAKDWPWSSYRATAGLVDTYKWLTTDWILATFSKKKKAAIQQYRTFVADGRNQPKPWGDLKNQIYLGDDNFVDEMQCQISPDTSLSEVPSSQTRQLAKPLTYYEKKYKDRNTAISKAYESGGYSLKEIGDYYNLHYSWVSRIAKAKNKA
jgi:putative transposase